MSGEVCGCPAFYHECQGRNGASMEPREYGGMKVSVEQIGSDYVERSDHVDRVLLDVDGDSWEIVPRSDGRLAIRLRESKGSISRSALIVPISGNYFEIGSVE